MSTTEPEIGHFHPEDMPKDLVIKTRSPQRIPVAEESFEFHAARILFLLKYVGGRDGKIVGRTKLAKLDFFVRYPVYLAKALGDMHSPLSKYLPPESPMIRYKYGPWDPKYYNVFANLVARGLIDISPSSKGDVFKLTESGKYAVQELEVSEFEEIIERCELVAKLFKNKSGKFIKDYIYKNYPEIVGKALGEEIS